MTNEMAGKGLQTKLGPSSHDEHRIIVTGLLTEVKARRPRLVHGWVTTVEEIGDNRLRLAKFGVSSTTGSELMVQIEKLAATNRTRGWSTAGGDVISSTTRRPTCSNRQGDHRWVKWRQQTHDKFGILCYTWGDLRLIIICRVIYFRVICDMQDDFDLS